MKFLCIKSHVCALGNELFDRDRHNSTKRIHCCAHMESLNVLELVAIMLVLSAKRTALDLLFITSDKSVT